MNHQNDVTAPHSSRPAASVVIAVVLVVATIAVYLPALTGQFVEWDDSALITENPLLQRNAGWAFLDTWRAPYAGLYAPLTYTAYAAVAAVSRAVDAPMNPALFHAVSLLLHVAGGLALWRWLRRLSGRSGPAAVGALVWLLHPIQVESVAWASGLNSVLAGVLAIVALWIAAIGTTTSGRGRWPAFLASAVAVALSLCAKPSGVLLPLMVLAVHRLVLSRPWRETLALTVTWAVVALPFAVVGRSTQLGPMDDAAPALAERGLVAAHAVGFYLSKAFVPTNFGIDYGLRPAVVLSDGRWVVPTICAAVVALLAAAAYAVRRRGWPLAALIVFIAGVGPVLGFVPFYFQNYSTVADRYAYLSMAGLALAVTFLLQDIWLTVDFASFDVKQAGRLPRFAVAAALIGLGVLTARQVPVWHDTRTLMRQAMAVNHDSVVANGQLGTMAFRDGNFAFAETALRRALDRRDDAGLRATYAGVLLETGRPDQAATEFVRSLNEEPKNYLALNALGRSLAMLGKDEDAVRAFAASAQLAPGFADAPANAGECLARLGRHDAARSAFERALAISPRHTKASAGLRTLNGTNP